MTYIKNYRNIGVLVISIFFFLACKKKSTDNDAATSSLCGNSNECIYSFTYNSEKLFYYTNYDLNADLSHVENVIVVVHGLSYDALDQFTTMNNTVAGIGKEANTLVVSMLFKKASLASAGELYWNNASWRNGYQSASSDALGSYFLMDYMVNSLILNRAANVSKVIIAGHSAGGQFSGRYGVQSNLERVGVDFYYVVANPSSLLYPVPERWNASNSSWELNTSCSGYNNYPYGLENINNSYGDNIGANVIQNRFAMKNFVYLLGTADLGSADNSCGANLMGSSRYERGTWYYDMVTQFYPTNNHDKVLVPNIAHDHDQMFRSSAFSNWLTGHTN